MNGFYLKCLFCFSFGTYLKDFTRLALVLKAAQQWYEWTSAAVFSKGQILLSIQIKDDSLEWVLRKAVVALLYCGGLRGHEL